MEIKGKLQEHLHLQTERMNKPNSKHQDEWYFSVAERLRINIIAWICRVKSFKGINADIIKTLLNS